MSLLLWIASLILFVQQPGTPAGLGGAPAIKLKALPAREAVAPGESVDVVLQLDIPKPWHMYHPIILDTGVATTYSFQTPPGVTVGELRYPSPEFGELSGIRYLEYLGRVSALTTVTFDKSVKAGETIEIEFVMKGLACIEACIPVTAKTTLTLPVKAGPATAVNEDAFKAATAKLPPALRAAPYLKGSTIEASKSKIGINEPAEIVATLKIEKGHHIQDRDPGIEGLIATQIFIETPDGIEFAAADKQIWPEPKTREITGVGRVRELAGEVKIRIPFKVTDAEIKLRAAALRALVYYQVCTDAGQCYPPAFAEQIVRFEIVGGKAQEIAGAERPGASAGTGDVNPATVSRPRAAVEMSVWVALLLALLGGLIMNITPCVLPVLSIKIVGFVEQAGDHPGRVLRLGLAFAAGVIAWFWIMAAVAGLGSVQLRSQFQNPLQNVGVVMVLATIIHVMALNLFGVFEIVLPGAAAGRLDQAARREGYGGAFAKGLVATLLGTSCTAPLIGAAITYAVAQPIGLTFLVFTVAGIGMALPYVLLAANPRWTRFVPKPGKWMVTFKQAMGFVLLGTAIWLLWVMRKQVGPDGVVLFAGFLTFVGLGAWWIGKVNPTAGTGPMVRAWIGALAVCVLGWFVTMRWLYDPSHARPREAASAIDEHAVNVIVAEVRASDWQRIPWVAYQPGLGAALAKRGQTVYVDYTADWCLNCKVNLKTVLESDAVRARMRELNVIPIEADYTANDSDMRKDIEALGKISVPVNIIYPAGKPDQYILLPEILTWGIVLDALKQAGPSAGGGASVTLKVP